MDQTVQPSIVQSHAEAPRVPAGMLGKVNQNPAGLGLWGLIKEDYITHGGRFFEQGFWAVALHRFGNWRMDLPKVLRAPCSLLHRILFAWVEWTCGITLPYTVKLGRRVRIWHHSGMILNAASIGNDCHIRQNTTFGVSRTHENYQLPVIEDRVDIGCGVAILGAVRVGHDSVIGANAVVIKDVPPFAVVGGVPAKVIRICDEQKSSPAAMDTQQ